MTPVFCCGFECGILSAVGGEHFQSTGTASISTTTVRSGSRSIRFNPTAATGSALSPTFSSSPTYIWRLYVWFASLPTSDARISFMSGPAGDPGAWFKQSDSSIYAGISGAYGATGVQITTQKWYRIDIKVEAQSNPWLIDVKVDGVDCGQKTNAVASSSSTNIRIGNNANNTMDMFIDDVIISQDLADYPIGKGYIHPYTTIADGTHNIAGTGDFQRGNTAVDILNATTTAWQLVDDVPLPSGAVAEADCWRGVAPATPATDYVEGLFGPAAGFPTPTIAPRAVDVILAHHQIATTAGQMEVRLNDNGTTVTVFNTGVGAAGVTTYRYARNHFATAPTGGAWTVTAGAGNFNNIRCRFLAQDANPDQCLDAIMIEAEFAEFEHKQPEIQQPYFGKTIVLSSGQKNNIKLP